ncbi:glycoside hydrolase family protein [Ralstonia solanacearum]|uniref:glycoside hydrolase family 24 protein n=1 Tax=Ralstonia pseudosolanacearum TaxID=1310165 RepID=UPI00030026FF|nr:glycoside hydrolase family protein [Ralstonia pseudosolanacearum]AOE89646.1 Lysozyme [Ralstonia solanacearum]APF86934.1 lysozyme [Ralstonia solanacearum FJAT-1458]AXW57438.1 lysozyme [Ralstonia solanacearum]NKA12019.1 lysozyme [Ralstonia solanacearum]NKA47048.1 lysozyme [Ralstonia solanacearum]
MPFTDPAKLGGRNLAAFLDMLSYSEGTDNGRQPTRDRGYDVLVGGGLFVSYADHPRILVELPRLGIKSTAAGRYQHLARWYDAYRRQLRLTDFGPAAQDAIAVQQIRERGALADIQAGRLAAAIDKCRNIWASLPGAGYGQHEHKLETLRTQYLRCGGQEGAA